MQFDSCVQIEENSVIFTSAITNERAKRSVLKLKESLFRNVDLGLTTRMVFNSLKKKKKKRNNDARKISENISLLTCCSQKEKKNEGEKATDTFTLPFNSDNITYVDPLGLPFIDIFSSIDQDGRVGNREATSCHAASGYSRNAKVHDIFASRIVGTEKKRGGRRCTVHQGSPLYEQQGPYRHRCYQPMIIASSICYSFRDCVNTYL